MIHQGRYVGYQAIQYQSYDKRTEKAFHSSQLHQSRTQKHQRQYKYKLYNTIVVFPEKPPTDTRKRKGNQYPDQNKLDNQPQPKQIVGLSSE